jgi:flagellin
MSVINTNVPSLKTQMAMAVNSRGLHNAMEQLSTGRRINSAADDAAGLAISQGMTAQIRGLNQAIRNANDGISMLQTAEGATNEIGNILQRMRELAVQSANDTYNDDVDRAAMDTEFQSLSEEINRIATVTTWNNKQIFDSVNTFDYHVGFASAADNKITVMTTKLTNDDFGDTGTDISAEAVDTKAHALDALDAIDTAINDLNAARANMGGYINRLNFTVDNLSNISTHLSESRSRIEDADYAQASSDLAKHQVIQQAATAMLAQANQSSQSVLTLLK